MDRPGGGAARHPPPGAHAAGTHDGPQGAAHPAGGAAGRGGNKRRWRRWAGRRRRRGRGSRGAIGRVEGRRREERDWSGDGEGDGGDASLDVPVAADVGGEWHEMEKFKKLFYSSKTFFLNIETVLPCVLNPCLSCLFK